MKSAFVKQLIQLGVSATLIAILLWQVDFGGVLQILSSGDAFYLLLSYCCVSITRVLMPLKWQILYSPLGELSLLKAFRIYMASSFMGQFLPSTVGADVARVYMLGRQGYLAVPVVISIVVERGIGLLVAVVAGLVSGLILLGTAEGDWRLQLEALSGVIACGLLVVLAVLLKRSLFIRALKIVADQLRVKRVVTEEAESFIFQARESIAKVLQKLPVFTLLTVVEYSLAVLSVYFCAAAFHIQPTASLWLVIPMYFLIIRLPISFLGFGLHEIGLLYLLTRLGVASETGFAVGFVHHIFLLIAVLPGAFFLTEVRAAKGGALPGTP